MSHLDVIVRKKIDRTIENMKKHNINGYFAENQEELHTLLENLIDDHQTVSVGGSMTLFETQTIEYLRKREITFLDRYAEDLEPADIKDIYFKAFDADVYLSSTNALTEEGELYNVDGNGNRVACLIYGPRKVIVIAGSNKIVKDLDEAINRNRETAAPANAVRLNRKTPCATLGYCTDCDSPEKICHNYTVIGSQGNKERMHVIITKEAYGY